MKRDFLDSPLDWTRTPRDSRSNAAYGCAIERYLSNSVSSKLLRLIERIWK